MTTNRAICEWTVSGMDCASCASKVRGAVERLPGVSDVDVALMTERLRLTLDEGQTQRDQIEAIIKGLGYGIAAKGSSPDWKRFVLPDGEQASRADGSPDATGLGSDTGSSELESIPTPGSRWYQTAKGRLVIGTGLLLAAAWAVKLLASQDVATWAFVLATLIGVAPTHTSRRGVRPTRAMPFTIEMLMTIAADAARSSSMLRRKRRWSSSSSPSGRFSKAWRRTRPATESGRSLAWCRRLHSWKSPARHE